MKSKKLLSFLYGASCVLQAALLGVVFLVQWLTTQKAGVNHHVRFTRTYWLHHYLTPHNVLILCVLLLAAAVCLLLFLLRVRKRHRAPAAAALILCLVWDAALVLSLLLPTMRSVLVYPYLLIALSCCLLLSVVCTALGLALDR